MKNLKLIIITLASTLLSAALHADTCALHAETSDATLSPEQTARLVQPYIALQEALASDNLEASKAAAAELQAAIPEERLEEAVGALKAMHEAEDLAAARQPFKVVSETLIETFRQHTPATESGLYLAYCPMAYDNTGAYWVQDDQTVNNPYFGSMMLRCGVIRETLAESSSNNEQPHGHHNH